ncbi:hypothetical protein [Brucella pituitosa]|uniref:hypothetical protein n=1 Tax=Brucella pituitosa TaxID=571256 RepID=UPI003F4AD691
MAVASWPTELPRPNREGYQGSPGEGRLKKRNEAGPPGYRRRTSSIPKYVSMTLDVSRDQLARFDRFYEEEVAHGSLPFLMPDPTTTGWPLLTTDGHVLTDHLGRPLLLEKTWLCLFGDTLPSQTVSGVRFRLSFQIVVMP